MRRLPVIVLSLLLVLGVGGVVIDRLVVREVTERALAEVDHAVSGERDLVIDGFPFLTQVLRGELTEVRGSAEAVEFEGVRVEQLHLTARGVTTSEPYQVAHAELNALVPDATMTAELRRVSGLDNLSVRTTESGIRVTTDVLGQELGLGVTAQAEGRVIELGVESVVLGGVTVSTDVLPASVREAVNGLRVGLDGMPEGLELSRIETVEGGVLVRLTGTGVTLDPDEWGAAD